MTQIDPSQRHKDTYRDILNRIDKYVESGFKKSSAEYQAARNEAEAHYAADHWEEASAAMAQAFEILVAAGPLEPI